nr:translation initiation factor IF-2-like [Oryctolagus cuniculus]
MYPVSVNCFMGGGRANYIFCCSSTLCSVVCACKGRKSYNKVYKREPEPGLARAAHSLSRRLAEPGGAGHQAPAPGEAGPARRGRGPEAGGTSPRAQGRRGRGRRPRVIGGERREGGEKPPPLAFRGSPARETSAPRPSRGEAPRLVAASPATPSLFRHQKSQCPTPAGRSPCLGSTYAAWLRLPYAAWLRLRPRVWGTETAVRPGSPRSSPWENPTGFPYGPHRAAPARVNKDPTCPQPAARVPLLRLCLARGRAGEAGGGRQRRPLGGYLFSLPLQPFLPESRLQAAPGPRGSAAAPEPPAPILRARLSHSLLIIFYKSNATQFFPHYREPWGGRRAIGGRAVTWAGSRGPGRKKGVLFGVNLDSNSVIYQGIS